MRYTTGFVMLLLAVGVLAWALSHRRRVLALVSKETLARHAEAREEDPKPLSLFDLGALLALLACCGYCITIQTRYRMTFVLAARDAPIDPTHQRTARTQCPLEQVRCRRRPIQTWQAGSIASCGTSSIGTRPR